jgi:putative transposase
MNKCINHGVDADVKSVHSQVLQNVSDRISKAYQNFFRRVKEKQNGKNINVGYPRFKKEYKSFTYPQDGYRLDSNKLRLSKIGIVNLRIGQKQNRIKGQIKTLTIKREPTGKWFACFSCVEEVKPTKAKKGKKIGVDLGLEKFATLSNGETIENHRFLVKSESRLKRACRILSRRKKGSKRREKARHRVALLHEKIANQRHYFHHQITRKLVDDYGTIVIEDLKITNMVRHPYLAKHISDASWGQFARFLCYKAESAGCRVEKVDPRGTSQDCSQCGNQVPKTLAQRWHRCPKCGVKMDRDFNASINILNRATVGTTESYARGDGSSVQHITVERSPSKKREAHQLVVG